MKIIAASFLFGLGVCSPMIYHTIKQTNQYLWISPLVLAFVGYGSYKLSFKNKESFKFFLFRQLIKVKWSWVNFSTKLKQKPEDQEILPIQTKSMKLWKLLLRDDTSQISCSLVNRIRQIEKDNMLLILSPINQLDYQLTIMDVDNNKSCLYEIPIYSRYSENLIEVFDNENERRMNLGQSEKRQSIHNDLDKLIFQQQEFLKNKSVR